MPYIEQRTREAINEGRKPYEAGELNYKITKLCLDYINGVQSYKLFNEVIGALECCKLEMYRRAVAPYEDKKAEVNGDVYLP